MSQAVIEPESGIAMIARMVADQSSLTAVDRFAQAYETASGPAAEQYYRDLIPLAAPGEGEQYAFEVDLDACSGCKACVAACHSLNGLEEDETWRSVGLMVGGASDQPTVQHVTMACHHCVEPACLEGCPVEAYEKDPITGIVRHLDDQCIGCQYCILKCPYDVPVYSASKGIVRKCDMCEHRLAADEAPACVQGCPNKAIRISIVTKQAVREDAEASAFLPAAPDPGYTLPTTAYQSEKPAPRNTLPADYFSVQSSHGHLPLVFMLVLTQMSVGAFVVEHAMYAYFSLFRADIATEVRPWHLIAALLLGGLGLGAAIFHLGRPFYAYRAMLGLRTSWLSREILAFNLFAGASTVYVSAACLEFVGTPVPAFWQYTLGGIAAAAGLGAVFSSVMIYVDTRRPLWRFTPTSLRFLLTAMVLGIPTALLVSLTAALFSTEMTVPQVMSSYGGILCRVLLGVVIAKLVFEASAFVHLRAKQHTPLKRSAMLLTGPLSMTTVRRFFFGIVGGVLLPLVLLAESSIADEHYHPMFSIAMTALILGLLTAGEMLERYLFFAASVSPRMPGSP